MRDRLFIHSPIIKECKSDFFENAIRICSTIDFLNNDKDVIDSKECYYEFDCKYANYIVTDRCDAFVLGLLSTAMENGFDIEFEKPISERLVFQLNEYYIPMISKYNETFPMKNISLIGNTVRDTISTNCAVATGCSGGVDSFFTIEKYIGTSGSNKLTHLVCSSSGTLDHVEERIRYNYKKMLQFVKKIGSEYNLEVIGCYNNLYEFYNYPYKSFHTFFTTTFCSVAFALNKLISVYYANSGIPLESFTLDLVKHTDQDCSAFDLFTTQVLTTDSMTVYSSGMEKNRNEKIEFFADSLIPSRNLSVCGIEMDGAIIDNGKINCSKCKKCLRTMFSLYTIGKLEKYNQAFDVNDFEKNLSKRVGSIIAYDHPEFTSESMKRAKENDIRVPLMSYLYAYLVFRPLEFLRKTLRKFKIVKTIGYKLKLDYLMHGYRRGEDK